MRLHTFERHGNAVSKVTPSSEERSEHWCSFRPNDDGAKAFRPLLVLVCVQIVKELSYILTSSLGKEKAEDWPRHKHWGF